MSKKLKSIDWLLEIGFSIILLKENAKSPLQSGWQDKATNDPKTVRRLIKQNPTANIGIATGSKSGVVVLDFDVKNDQKGLETYHHLCTLFGKKMDTLKAVTPSGGFHLFFRYSKNNPLGNKIGILGGLDIRGDGGLIAVAPSEINEKKYFWDQPEKTILTLPRELVAILEFGEEILPPIDVIESQRNDTVFHFARMLHKHIKSDSLKKNLLLLAAKHCSPPLPEDEALKCLESAKNYVPEDELGGFIGELNREYAVTMIGSNCVVLHEFYHPVYERYCVEFISPAHFHNFLSNRRIQINRTYCPISRIWMNHQDRREYKSVIFSPSGDHEGYYNMWRGFACKPVKGDWRLFKEHIRYNICNGDEEVFRYVLAWLADAVQNPDKRPGTAIVLRGPQGVGKSLFANIFGSLFGQHFIQVTSPKHLTGNFNSHLKDVCLVFADEALWGSQHHVEGVLKSLVTEKDLVIEHKGKDVIILPNFIRLIIASNNSWVVPAGLEERRFLILDVCTEFMQDHAYFGKMIEQMDAGGREAMLYELMHHDYSDVNLRQIPYTKGLEEMKVHSMTPIQSFWYDVLKRGYLLDVSDEPWPEWVAVSDLYAEYRAYSSHGLKYTKGGITQFGMEIRKLMPKFNTSKRRKPNDLTKKQHKGYELPSLHKCRKFFDMLTQAETNWKE